MNVSMNARRGSLAAQKTVRKQQSYGILLLVGNRPPANTAGPTSAGLKDLRETLILLFLQCSKRLLLRPSWAFPP
jgi:hypothetical protein